ncbi:hypothetical protein SLS62_000118 [Diatrype stigma]|uniref:Fucose-specific lectin n=1 Tax=Diatrype stigma TaxID=117547 RepID=A0AAN9UY57_9PEZI
MAYQQPGAEFYSGLEVDDRVYHSQGPEVVAVDRENLPEVDHYRENLPEVNHYANAPLSAGAYSNGTYSTVHSPQATTTYPLARTKEDLPYGAAGYGSEQPLPPLPPSSAHGEAGALGAAGAAGAGAAGGAAAASEPRICGVRRKAFLFLITLAAVVIVAVVIGVSVGVVTANHRIAEAKSKDSGDAAGSADGPPNEIRLDTRIATTNFTDEVGNENYLVVYQLYSGAIWYVTQIYISYPEIMTVVEIAWANLCAVYMSTYNSSESQSKWLVSPVVDGKTGSLSLDDVQNGTSFAIDTYMDATDRLLHLYWQAPDDKVKSARFDSFSTETTHNAQDWYEAPASDLYVASAGSPLASYGRECTDAPCPQWSYLFYQEDDKFEGAGLDPGGQWEVLGPSLGASSGGFDSNSVTPPGANTTSLALTMQRADAGADGFRSLSLFYRAGSGVLAQIIYERNTPQGAYRGYALPREDLGARTGVAAFTTGTNDTQSGNSTAEPLGFQVLTADPDASDRTVQLTYYRDDAWAVADQEVAELVDCAPLATLAANRARRVYCVVESDDNKAEIVEFAWNASPEADAQTYTSYRRVGTVNTTVEL